VKATVLALCAITLWATNAFVAKLALSTLPVEQIQELQFAGASAVFLVTRLGSANSARGGPLVASIALGLLGVTGTMIFQYLAFAAGPIAEVNIVAYSWPLLAALLFMAGNVVARSWRYAVLTSFGFLGVVLVILPNASSDRFATLGSGHFWAIASALCMASYSAAIGRIKCNQDTAHLVGSLAGFAIAAIWSVTSLTGLPHPTSMAFWLGLYLGAGPIGLGYFFWARAMRNDASGRTAALGYLTPVGSTALLVLTGATISPLAVIGSLLVIACSAVTGIEAKRNATA